MSITPKNWAMLYLVNPYFFLNGCCYFTKRSLLPFLISLAMCIIVELVIKINRLGKHIEEGFAHKYYQEIGLGIDFTARDVQEEVKAKGLPWEKAKGFDGSAVIGRSFIPKEELDLNNIDFTLEKNGDTVQVGNSKDMLFNFDKIIAYISQFYPKIGDLIYTGTPLVLDK